MRYLSLLCLIVAVFAASAAKAQDDTVLAGGEAVVTSFSGAKPAGVPGAAGDPADGLFIDLDGASAQILRLEPGASPQRQPPATLPKLRVKARDVGQVFAIGLDDGLPAHGAQATPNIYLGATSAFGLRIVAPASEGDGRPHRLKKGDANAEWMAGQFGAGGGPGSIYRVDGKTGAVSLFANVPGNGGPGLGGIVFDPATRQFFVSDLDTGLIYRLDAAGTIVASFDHGRTGRAALGLPAIADDGIVMDIKSPAFDSEDQATWGLTAPERRVWGLGLHAGRLYYAPGPEIWSVSINLDGTFGSDPRRETETLGREGDRAISDITFDGQNRMYVAERGGSAVLRFAREIPDDRATPGTWMPIPDEYPPDHRNTSGGVARGFGYDEAGIYAPAVDLLPDATPERTYNLSLEKRSVACARAPGGLGFLCDYVVRVTNKGPDAYVGPIVVKDRLPAQPAGAVMALRPGPPWLCFAISPSEQQCTYAPAALLPGESVDLHLTVDLPVAAPGCHLDSQAGLVWPWGLGDIDPADDFDLATATIPAPHCPPPALGKANLKLSMQPLAEVCADRIGFFECRYNVVVRNTGAGAYNGLIKVEDTIPQGATATFSARSWNCTGSAPAFSCERWPVALLPNQTVNLNVIVKLPKTLAGPLRCQAKNEVKIVAAGGGADQNADVTDDEAEATMVLPGERAQCPKLDASSNLTLETKGPDGECPVIWGSWICAFKVTVQNFGKAYSSPIRFTDALPFGGPAGATISFQPPAGWTCGGPVEVPNLYQCGSENPDLAPLEKVEIRAIVKIPVAPVATCEVTNSAEIVKAMGGTLANTAAGDDASSARAKLAAAVAQGICLSNLKLTNTGPSEPCPVMGDAWECKFKVTLQNFGKPYLSPIQLIGALPSGTSAGATVSFEPPFGWTCGEAVQFPQRYQCASDNPKLAHQGKVEIPMTVRVPVTPDATCGITSATKIAKAPGGSAQNFLDADDSASAQAQFAPALPSDQGQGICLTSNLSLEVMNRNKLFDGSCPAADGNWICRFLLKVTNLGEPFAGEIRIVDALPVDMPEGSTIAFDERPGWDCDEPLADSHLYQCRSTTARLGKGKSAFIPGTVRIPLERVMKCEVTTNAKIGEALDSLQGDDSASLTMPLQKDVILPDGRIACSSKQSNLELETTGWVKNMKFCQVSGDMWRCEWKVKITNTGPDAYTSPVAFVDELIGPAPPKSALSLSQPVNWTCRQPAPQRFECRSENPDLAAGESVDFGATVRIPLGPVTDCALKNRAYIAAPQAPTPLNLVWADDSGSSTLVLEPHPPPDFPHIPSVCLMSHVDEPRDPLVVPEGQESNLAITKTAGAGELTQTGQSTKFAITVTNQGPGVFNAPVEIRDTFFDGAIVEPSNGNWSAPWLCEDQSAAGHPEQAICTHPKVALDPGESVMLELEIEAPLSFVAPSGAEARCGYSNKVEILRPAGGSPENVNADDDVAFAQAGFAPFESHGTKFCRPGLKTDPGPKRNLTIAKTAAACDPTAAGQKCRFTITIANAGPGVHKGAIELRDTLFDGATVEPSNGNWSAPWTCLGQSVLGHPEQGVCTHPPVELAPGESVDLELEIEAPMSFVAPSASRGKCGYESRIEIVAPAGGSHDNAEAGDDVAFAEAKFEPFEKDGKTFCRPETNLAVTQAAGDCATKAAGQDCRFTITVTNKGPSVHEGAIELRDTLLDGAIVEPSNASWSAPWVCKVGSPAGHPGQGVCTHPPVELGPGESLDLRLEIEAPDSFVAPLGSPAKCGLKNRIEILEPAGGTRGNMNAGDDAAFAEVRFAPFEKRGKTFCGLGLTPPTPACRRGWSRTPIPGKCCPPLSSWDGGRCKSEVKPPEAKCPANSVASISGECRCPDGMRLLDGRCQTIRSEPEKACPPGTRGKYPDCARIDCPANQEWIDGDCRCRDPLKWNGKVCAAETPATCPADSIGLYPDCRCKQDTMGTPGKCVRIIVPRKCQADSVGIYPKCRCKRGTAGTPGKCKPIVKLKKCPKGFRGKPPKCKRIPPR